MGRKKDESPILDESPAMSEAREGALNGDGPVAVRAPKRTENKRQRFLRLVEKRVSNALKRIKQVRALGKTAQYEYTPEEAAKITASLIQAVDGVAAAFDGQKEETNVFRL